MRRARYGPSYINDDLKEENRGDAVVARLGSAGSSEGLEEVRVVKRPVDDSLPAGRVVFDPFISRGLYYYTGPVFEVFHGGTEKPVLSIASGGRYDDLIEMFSQRPIPACGGSLGFERILLLLQEVPTTPIYSDVLVTIWDNESSKEMIALAEQLRTAGIGVEVSLNPGSLGPQLRYATQRDMVVALICGPAERVAGRVIVKDLQSGEQTAVAECDVVELARRTLIANGRM